MRPEATADTKMMYLIRRRAGVSREELVAHWFANHMPIVIDRQKLQASAGKLAASRYIATLFDPDEAGLHPWDGVAQLWFSEALPTPRHPHGGRPADSFQERAEPYMPWATTEYVVMDGELALQPLTLNAPFPCTRSGFFKITYLVRARSGVDYGALFDHWLDVHTPNVIGAMERVGGFRYVVSQSQTPESEAYAGMAELYFPDAGAFTDFREALKPDGIDEFIAGVDMQSSVTEMVGIP